MPLYLQFCYNLPAREYHGFFFLICFETVLLLKLTTTLARMVCPITNDSKSSVKGMVAGKTGEFDERVLLDAQQFVGLHSHLKMLKARAQSGRLWSFNYADYLKTFHSLVEMSNLSGLAHTHIPCVTGVRATTLSRSGWRSHRSSSGGGGGATRV